MQEQRCIAAAVLMYPSFQVPNGAVSDGKGRRIPFPNHSMLIKNETISSGDCRQRPVTPLPWQPQTSKETTNSR
ncbi:MAG: hypothetical protein RLZZ429_2247 [Bacteroidota bacterium]